MTKFHEYIVRLPVWFQILCLLFVLIGIVSSVALIQWGVGPGALWLADLMIILGLALHHAYWRKGYHR